MSPSASYTIWIEAEHWPPEERIPSDCNTDVIVTFSDGSRWVASFFSYASIGTLTQKNRQTGECLSGAYFWSSDLILIDEASHVRIEAVIADLLREREFEMAFTRVPSESSPEEDASPDGK